MPSLNFMERFAGLVERGEKLTTIRKVRKRPIKISDTVHLYTGQRTKACRKLGVGRCMQVRAILIKPLFNPPDTVPMIFLDGRPLPAWRLPAFTTADGFDHFDDFTAFFTKQYGLPFEGVLIEWELEDWRN